MLEDLLPCYSGRSRGGARGPTPLFWVKRKEEMTEGRKAGRASKIEPGLLLSSKSGFAKTTVTVSAIALKAASTSQWKSTWCPRACAYLHAADNYGNESALVVNSVF